MYAEKVDAAAAELARCTAQIMEDLAPVWARLKEIVEQAAATLSESLKQVSAQWWSDPSMEFVLAYAWACEARPEWVRRLNCTKKARTRKKYQDRILRDYRARGDKKGE